MYKNIYSICRFEVSFLADSDDHNCAHALVTVLSEHALTVQPRAHVVGLAL